MPTAKQIDPTRTLTLRQKFVADMARRFAELKRAIRKSIVDNDAFALKANDAAGPGAFDFPRSADKVDAFMDWLQAELDRGVLEVTRGAQRLITGSSRWSDVYVRAAYGKGLQRAKTELQNIGTPALDVTDAFRQPLHADRLGLMYTRTFEDLRGITQAMGQQIRRELTAGIAAGKGPMDIADAIIDRVDAIGLSRARTLARTEVIAAHHQANINSYESAGVQGVSVIAEFTTAKDNAVCEECQALEAEQYFTLEEARSLIPVHPNCRCVAVPFVLPPGTDPDEFKASANARARLLARHVCGAAA